MTRRPGRGSAEPPVPAESPGPTGPTEFTEPTDPLEATVSMEFTVSPRREEPLWAVLGAVAAGGALGALGRYGAGSVIGDPAGGFGWAVFTANTAGCLLIGVLMVLITGSARPAHPLVRPFLGAGVLGGFTTFSGYTRDVQAALQAGRPQLAMLYLAATLVAALLAVAAGMLSARRMLRWRRAGGAGRRRRARQVKGARRAGGVRR